MRLDDSSHDRSERLSRFVRSRPVLAVGIFLLVLGVVVGFLPL
jgi:hypothetical protein